ncbi:hypothetical protein GCM10027404_32440 [Arthrobacter tumbae]|uniref:hypothetical protein n=1 Tax=Arthrobacter tumbae TaxID=163874 RepID=UPI00195B1112|nr:hypothetical protein [Arthrobacter tumbae]MBM7781848.1 hypothetical protein [Arthrobacter tumbae]
MDQNFLVPLILLLGLIWFLAAATVLGGVIELAFFRTQDTGQAAKHRKQYVNNVMKVVLTSGAAAIVTVLLLKPDMKEVWPEFSIYSPLVSLVAVAIAALITYRLELASEAPATVYDLQIDLRKSWQEEETLSRHCLALHNRWLKDFKVTDGGRSMMSSKRPLHSRFQAAIDLSLNGNYRDTTFRRLALLTSPRMVQAMSIGHPWKTLWLLTPAVAALLSVACLTTIQVMEHLSATFGVMLLGVASVVLGLVFSTFNIWTRSTVGLRKYCDLKRREELCALMLKKLKVLAAPAKAVHGQPQQTPAGSLRRLIRAVL